MLSLVEVASRGFVSVEIKFEFDRCSQNIAEMWIGYIEASQWNGISTLLEAAPRFAKSLDFQVRSIASGS